MLIASYVMSSSHGFVFYVGKIQGLVPGKILHCVMSANGEVQMENC